jgi:hypothetical protein
MTDKEFFKEFDIEQLNCAKCKDKYCSGVGLNRVPDHCSKYKQIYITAEIRERLEEILLNKFGHIHIWRTDGHETYGFSGNYEVGTKFILNNTSFEYGCIKEAKTRKDALLNLCIQLKDEIKEQVMEVFNAR